MSYFFLSYSRRENEIALNYVKTFHDKLCSVIGRKIGEENYSSLGFMDQNITLGADWPEELEDALQKCRTIVCLYSPLYFNSDFCGKEYHIFQLRRELFVKQNSENGNPTVKHPPVIKPVIWYPFRASQFPQAVNFNNYELGGPDAIHNRIGVSRMLENPNRYGDDYNDFIELLSEQIIETFNKVDLPRLERFPPLSEIPNHFETAALMASIDSNGSEPKPVRKGGPKLVHFVYVAGSPSEIGDSEIGYSRSQQPYEEDGRGDWKPYLPDKKPLGPFAQRVVGDDMLGFESQELLFSDTLAANIRRLEGENNLVVLFIDSWTLMLPRYREILERLDEHNYDNCGIIAPLNKDDEESRNDEEQLNELVHFVFARYRKYSSLWARALFEGGINSFEKLEDHLKAVVRELQEQMIKSSRKRNKTFPRSPKSDIPQPHI